MYKRARKYLIALLALGACWRESIVEHIRILRVETFVYKPCVASWNDPAVRPCIVYAADDLTCDRSPHRVVCDDAAAQLECELEAWRSYGTEVSWWVDDAWPRCAKDE